MRTDAGVTWEMGDHPGREKYREGEETNGRKREKHVRKGMEGKGEEMVVEGR